MRLYPAVSIVTLGVADVAAATRFYLGLGWRLSAGASNGSISFFSLNNIVLALFGSAELLADSGLSDTSAGHGDHLAQPDSDNQALPGQARMVLAQNYPSQTAVRLAMEEARDAGAKILVEASSTFWGGYHGVFADPDGHIWELAHNPFFPLAPDGSVDLPE